MKKTDEDYRKVLTDFPEKALLISIYHLRKKKILVITKNKIEYLGVFINIDKNLNIFLKDIDISYKGAHSNPEISNRCENIVLNGNKIIMIIPVI